MNPRAPANPRANAKLRASTKLCTPAGWYADSGEVFADQLGHFKHTHAGLAEDGFKRSVGVDLSFVGGVLKIFGLDVIP